MGCGICVTMLACCRAYQGVEHSYDGQGGRESARAGSRGCRAKDSSHASEDDPSSFRFSLQRW